MLDELFNKCEHSYKVEDKINNEETILYIQRCEKCGRIKQDKIKK